MYFKPRDNRFYSFVVKLAPTNRYLCTLFLVNGFAAAWFFIVYGPLSLQVQQYVGDCARIRADYKVATCAGEQCNSLKHEVERLQAELDIQTSIAEEVPLTYFIECAQESGVQLIYCKAGAQCNKKWCTTNNVDVQVQGKLKDIIIFFDIVAKQHNLCACNTYAISQATDGVCSVSCTFSLCFIGKKPFNLEQAEGLGG